MTPIQVILTFAAVLVVLLITMIIVLWRLSYNIPVAVLRFVGNRGRPNLILTKGKKWVSNGVPRLIVRGYKQPMRDFKSEHYFPTGKGKYGGLILWEFEDGYLTPCVPMKESKKHTPEQAAAVKWMRENAQTLNSLFKAEFSFDKPLYEGLKLKAVDDVDVDFMLQELARTDSQYQGGFGAFMMKYGGHIALMIVAVAIMVGIIVFFQEAPALAQACAQSAADVAKSGLLQEIARSAAPMG